MTQGRNLTEGEQKLCRRVFRWDYIHSENIEVVRRPKTMHFGGFTPYARINMDGSSYLEDYIGDPVTNTDADITKPPDPFAAHHFLHELAHSWQHLMGMAMLHLTRLAHKDAKAVLAANGFPERPPNMSRKDWKSKVFDSTYSYDINAGSDLLDFTLEQQCEIIADYYALDLQWMVFPPAKKFGHPLPTKHQLKNVLSTFLDDRWYVRYARPHNNWRARGRNFGR